MKRLLLVVCGLAACSARQPAVSFSEAAIAGCYQLQGGAWETDTGLARFYPVDAIPRTFELLATRAEGWAPLQNDTLPLFAARAVPDRPFTTWRRVRAGSDTIHVGTPMPLGGASLRLLPRNSQLVGTVSTFTDAIPPDGITSATAPIVAHRVDCSVMR